MHRFRVWAPKASTVDVKIGESLYPLTAEVGGWWQANVAEAGGGRTIYMF